MKRTLIAVIVAGSLRSLWRICNRCGGFAIRHQFPMDLDAAYNLGRRLVEETR